MSDSPAGPVLDYSGHHDAPLWTSLYRFYSEVEARFCANELEANGIRHQLWNDATKGTMGIYGAMIKVDLQVLSDDLERAKVILANHLKPEATNRLEPAEPDDRAQPREIPDEAGQPVRLLAVRAFDSVPDLREASLILESARIEAYVPRLVARGDSPRGQGYRFVLRVKEEDLPHAQQLLAPDAAEEPTDEPRCPRCGSWSVMELKHEFTNFFLAFVGRSKPAKCACMKCRYVGDPSEFIKTFSGR